MTLDKLQLHAARVMRQNYDAATDLPWAAFPNGSTNLFASNVATYKAILLRNIDDNGWLIRVYVLDQTMRVMDDHCSACGKDHTGNCQPDESHDGLLA